MAALLAFGLLLASGAGFAAARADEASPRERVDRLVQPLLEGALVEGLVVGLIQPSSAPDRVVDDSGTAIYGYGRSGASGAAAESPPTADTLFEIGSISKPFTALLLAEMVERGEVRLDEPVARLLPETVKIPSRAGREITLVDLATHTSGLPRMPKNFAPAQASDPYADYSADKLFEFLSSYELRRAPGEESIYSNLGMGLLGEALARRAKLDYETLLRERILGPLGMATTRLKLDDAARAQLAAGHDADGTLLPAWEFQALAGAGGIRSNARDMVTFLQANLYLPAGSDTPGAPAQQAEVPETLRRALALSQQPRHPIKTPPGEIALAWMTNEAGHPTWHNGQTGGYHSFAAFDRARGTGVVVLANSAVGAVDDLGNRLLQLLAGDHPEPPAVRRVAALGEQQLAPLVGVYALDLGVGGKSPLTVTLEKGRLWAQLPLQPKLGIYPSSPTEFFYKVVDAQLQFTANAAGVFDQVLLRQDGREYPGQRQAPPEKK